MHGFYEKATTERRHLSSLAEAVSKLFTVARRAGAMCERCQVRPFQTVSGIRSGAKLLCRTCNDDSRLDARIAEQRTRRDQMTRRTR